MKSFKFKCDKCKEKSMKSKIVYQETYKEIEFTPEDIYKELVKSGIKFKLNEEYKYLENSLTEDENGKTSGDYIKDYVDKVKRRK